MNKEHELELKSIASEIVDNMEGEVFDECLDILFDRDVIQETNNEGMERATSLMLFIAGELRERATWRLKHIES